MRRRDFLAAGLTLPVLAGCDLSLEQGLYNGCRLETPDLLLKHPLVTAAWAGLRADRVWDSHSHLFGNGQSNTGVWENDKKSIRTRVQRVFYVNASCGGGDNEGFDAGMVQRVTHLANEMPDGAKVMLLAFDSTWDANTRTMIKDQSVFSVSNEYAERVAKANEKRFEWIASIHPYRPDARERLAKAKAGGARAVKWLPPAMGIDCRHKLTLAFFEEMKRLDIPLLTHVGEERALDGAKRHEFGNPLLLRFPLDVGVRVIGAHCASIGKSAYLDRDGNELKGTEEYDFKLFEQLMAKPEYEKLLFGDLSATTQANRAKALPFIIEKRDWHHRLLNGSDYPLPGVMPIFSISAFAREKLIDEAAVPVLKELRQSNSLYFDFVLKRSLRYRGQKLPDAAFETRSFFDRSA